MRDQHPKQRRLNIEALLASKTAWSLSHLIVGFINISMKH